MMPAVAPAAAEAVKLFFAWLWVAFHDRHIARGEDLLTYSL